MRSIFLADAHLKAPTDDNYLLLQGFLHELEGNTDTLYIMGDLFDFWVGFPSNPFRQFDIVLDSLERLVSSGCHLVYFEGNHDFHLGEVFSKRLQAEIHSGPAMVTVQGKRLYLCHGDQINKNDRYYRLLRRILRSRVIASSVGCFPPAWALKVKKRLQKRSQAGYQVKKARWDYRKILLDFARQIQMQGCDGLVAGHFHLALLEKLDGRPFTLLSLGDWMGQYTYGEMLDGELRLMTYSPCNPRQRT
ncbi:MAG: UDP-2,3-diacylglucosamine diphosphatase [Deltaproteobacteria bacterium]|nr:UDP-2,3-diacylglucosamine diphosphatase [Deltaproteobacteria bacterium]